MPITLRNTTTFIAQYIIKRGEQILARLPGLEPGAQMIVPTAVSYAVTASTVIDGNTCISAPLSVNGNMGFLARILQVEAQGTYVFDVEEVPAMQPDQLTFESTCPAPVTFTLSADGVPLQNVVATDPYMAKTLETGDVFFINAVINGITTEMFSTSNPDVTVTAVDSSSDQDAGYFTLVLQ